MAGKATKVGPTEAQVGALVLAAERTTNPGVVDAATHTMLIVIARGIDELKAEAKK